MRDVATTAMRTAAFTALLCATTLDANAYYRRSAASGVGHAMAYMGARIATERAISAGERAYGATRAPHAGQPAETVANPLAR